ncbi:hypothetical protein Pelo_17423 [Pelomyxa schiedti]|nr:hypothetical protein Pelo_17423 [Pelomyxa schiedti]
MCCSNRYHILLQDICMHQEYFTVGPCWTVWEEAYSIGKSFYSDHSQIVMTDRTVRSTAEIIKELHGFMNTNSMVDPAKAPLLPKTKDHKESVNDKQIEEIVAHKLIPGGTLYEVKFKGSYDHKRDQTYLSCLFLNTSIVQHRNS